jgi:hypothetical protein
MGSGRRIVAGMRSQDRPVQAFDIEGQEVKCYMSDGQRLWQCRCAHFERTLRQYGEGFCPHTAVAIMRALEDGFFAL